MSTVVTESDLLAHLDRIAEAPDAVTRLRQFVYDLAIRGKLLSQDRTDTPAPGFGHDPGRETPILTGAQLPSGWSWAYVEDVAHTRLGKMLDAAKNKGTPHKYLRNTNVQWFRILLDDLKEMRVDESELPELVLRNGDVLICEGGHPGRCAVWQSGMVNMIFQKALHRVRPGPSLDSDFFTFCMFAYFHGGILRQYHTGVGIPHLTGRSLGRLLFPLPPIAEQRRIVRRVGELMVLCDRLETERNEREQRRDRLVISSLHRLTDTSNPQSFRTHAHFHLQHLPRLLARPEHIRQFRQTILDLAVRGRLAPAASDDSADRLVHQIREQHARVKANGKCRVAVPTDVESKERSTSVPSRWAWVRLTELLSEDSQNGYSRRPDEAPNGVPILRISAGTVRNDRIVAEEQYKLIGGVSDSEVEQYQLLPGDILACRFNGNRHFVGRLSLYLGYRGVQAIYPDKLIRLRVPRPWTNPKWLTCFAASDVGRSEIEALCATTVGNWGISAGDLKMIPVALPPLAEQDRIVAKVDELMSLCDQLESQLTTTQTESRRLLQAVLAQSLRGDAALASNR